MLAFFDFAAPAGNVGAVVEDEGDDDFGGAHAFLHEEEGAAEGFAGGGFGAEGGFGEGAGDDGEGGVGTKTALFWWW